MAAATLATETKSLPLSLTTGEELSLWRKTKDLHCGIEKILHALSVPVNDYRARMKAAGDAVPLRSVATSKLLAGIGPLWDDIQDAERLLANQGDLHSDLRRIPDRLSTDVLLMEAALENILKQRTNPILDGGVICSSYGMLLTGMERILDARRELESGLTVTDHLLAESRAQSKRDASKGDGRTNKPKARPTFDAACAFLAYEAKTEKRPSYSGWIANEGKDYAKKMKPGDNRAKAKRLESGVREIIQRALKAFGEATERMDPEKIVDRIPNFLARYANEPGVSIWTTRFREGLDSVTEKPRQKR